LEEGKRGGGSTTSTKVPLKRPVSAVPHSGQMVEDGDERLIYKYRIDMRRLRLRITELERKNRVGMHRYDSR